MPEDEAEDASSDPNDDLPGERIFSEIYNTDAMINEHERILRQPREEGDPDDLEYDVAPMLSYSDTTRLASFGGASLWPIYWYFLAWSKYPRGKPTCFPAHHGAYVPSVFLFASLPTCMVLNYSILATR